MFIINVSLSDSPDCDCSSNYMAISLKNDRYGISVKTYISTNFQAEQIFKNVIKNIFPFYSTSENACQKR